MNIDLEFPLYMILGFVLGYILTSIYIWWLEWKMKKVQERIVYLEKKIAEMKDEEK